MFVRSSYTLDQNLGLVCDYAAAYPETHYKNKISALCVVRFVLPPRCVLNLNIAPSVAAKKINIESIAIAIGHRNYRNATAMLSKRPALVVPYFVVFSSSKESCLVNLVDYSNNSCLVPIPTRIWNALSARVYGMLKPNINNALRVFYQNVSKLDGHALVCALRNDSASSIVKSPLERLEERAALIELPDLGAWTQVRGDLMQLIGDWDQAVKGWSCNGRTQAVDENS